MTHFTNDQLLINSRYCYVAYSKTQMNTLNNIDTVWTLAHKCILFIKLKEWLKTDLSHHTVWYINKLHTQ